MELDRLVASWLGSLQLDVAFGYRSKAPGSCRLGAMDRDVGQLPCDRSRGKGATEALPMFLEPRLLQGQPERTDVTLW
jgi:hypothetical protein